MSTIASTRPLSQTFAALALTGVFTLGSAALGAAEADNAFETIPAGEADQIEATAAIMMQLQDKRQKNDLTQNGQLLRGVHPKSHGCVRAEFTVNSDISPQYRVGLFANPGRKYDAWIRYSNAAALREDDLKAPPIKVGMPPSERENGSRGMAIKILDVEGSFLSKDNGRQAQDFLMINTPEFAFSDVKNYLRLNQILLLSKNGDDAGPFFLPLFRPLPPAGDPVWKGFWADFTQADRGHTEGSFAVIRSIKDTNATVANPLQVQYFGAAPFLFGEGRAMKFSAAPCEKVPQPSLVELRAANPSPNYLRAALTETMQGQTPICLDFKIQVRSEGLDTTLIEDATTMWPGELSGYDNVARIKIPVPQQPDTQESIDHCEKLAFTPWHSLEAHRPIGGINRLRQKVYDGSAAHRGAASE